MVDVMRLHRIICKNIEKPQGKIKSEIPIKLSLVFFFFPLCVLVVLNADSASGTPGKLSKMQTPGPQTRSNKLESLGVGAMDLYLKIKKHSRIFYSKIRLKNDDTHLYILFLSLSLFLS